MPLDLPRFTLLDELDARQDDVLRQLDALNERVEALLRSLTTQSAEQQTAAKAA